MIFFSLGDEYNYFYKEEVVLLRLTQDLVLEQRQQLIMTPRLQQAIKLLQLSTLELQDTLQEELMANPLLEMATHNEEEEDRKKESKELEWEEYLANSSYSFQSPVERHTQERTFEDFVFSPVTLEEHLLHQLGLFILDPREKEIGEYIIGNLDEKGFLTLREEEIAEDLEVHLDQVRDVLCILQSFDPPGIGAYDLTSSLLLQLSHRNEDTWLAQVIIKDYFEDLQEHRMKEISKALHVSREEVQKAFDIIRTLNPRPASGFQKVQDHLYLEPDLTVKKIENKFYILCNDLGPSLTISPFYRHLLKNNQEKKAWKYLKDRLDSALFLIKAIEQRRITVYRTMETILKLQIPFFQRGIRYLNPMTMQEVANEMGVHESTVSRATTNKYVQTDHGLFPMKFFFSSGIHKEEHHLSSTSVRQLIQDIIKDEDTSQPFSDNDLCLLLKEQDIYLSRRTVAKYRQMLGIASSSRRRRYD